MRIKNKIAGKIVHGDADQPNDADAHQRHDHHTQEFGILEDALTKRRRQILEEPLDPFPRHT